MAWTGRDRDGKVWRALDGRGVERMARACRGEQWTGADWNGLNFSGLPILRSRLSGGMFHQTSVTGE